MSQEQFSWFQIDVKRNGGESRYLTRFIANGLDDAKARTKKLMTGDGVKVMGSSLVAKAAIDRYIDDYMVSEVPESVYSRYNLNKQSEYDNFVANREPKYCEILA